MKANRQRPASLRNRDWGCDERLCTVHWWPTPPRAEFPCDGARAFEPLMTACFSTASASLPAGLSAPMVPTPSFGVGVGWKAARGHHIVLPFAHISVCFLGPTSSRCTGATEYRFM